MSKILAVDWDVGEARVAVARRRGAEAIVEQVLSIPLPDPSENGHIRASDIGPLLAADLQKHRISGDCLVGMGRVGLELRQLALPPMPDEELPEVVRFQAARQFSALGDDWTIDYLPLSADPQQPRRVLACVLPAKQLARIQQIVSGAGLRAKRLLLRPCAAASLLVHGNGSHPAQQPVLLVDLLHHEADLTAIVGGQVVYVRTARLPAAPHSDEQHDALAGEIRRTLAAVRNQYAADPLQAVILCGETAEHSELIDRLGQHLEMPVRCMDPFEYVALDPQLKERLPERRGRFAPLLGMLVDECRGAPPALDFLNPRKRPEAPNRRRLYAALAVAVALVLCLAAGGLWMTLRGLDRQIAGLEDELARLRRENESLQTVQHQAEQIDAWAAADPVWLDEFYRLAERFPPAESAHLTSLETQVLDTAVGRMHLHGFVDQHQRIAELEGTLRDEYRRVFVPSSHQDPDSPKRQWSFDATVEFHLPSPGISLERQPVAPAVAEKPKEQERQDAATGEPQEESKEGQEQVLGTIVPSKRSSTDG